MAADSRHADDAVLEGLAQCLEDRARELRQLVEEEDAPMFERARLKDETCVW